MSKTPYGIPGTSKGRQNGENFVAYSPNDHRRRYNASGSSSANIKMLDDHSLDPPGIPTQREALVANVTDGEIHGSPIPSPTLQKRPSWIIPSIEAALPNNQYRTESNLNGQTSALVTEQATTSAHLERSSSFGFASTQVPDTNDQNQKAFLVENLNKTINPGSNILDFVKDAPNKISQKGAWLPPLATEYSKPGNVNGVDTSDPSSEEIHHQTSKVPVPEHDTQHSPEFAVEGIDASARSLPPIHDPVNPHPGSTSSKLGPAIRRPARPARKGTKTAKPSDVERKHELSGILSVTGFILGVINERSDVIRGGVIPGEWVEKLGWDMAMTEENQDVNLVPDILWRLLVANREVTGSKPPQWHSRACLHGLTDPRVTDTDGNIHTVTPADRKISENVTRYFERVRHVVWNRRIIEVGAEGHFQGPLFGLAPRHGEVGDLVCILLGCSVPVVLKQVPKQIKTSRLTDENEGLLMYQLVGEAYIDGMMDGEAVEDTSLVNMMDFALA